MTWQEQLQEDVKKVLERDRPKKRSSMSFTPHPASVDMMASQPRKVRLNEEPKDNPVGLPLFLLVLLLGVGLVFAWYVKKGQQAPSGPPIAYQQPNNPYMPYERPYTPPGSSPQWRPGPGPGPTSPDPRLTQDVQNLKEVTQLMWEKQKATTERLTLLGIIANQNFTVLERGLPKSEMLYLNADWTIDRMPSQLNLDEADKEFLRRYLKQKQ